MERLKFILKIPERARSCSARGFIGKILLKAEKKASLHGPFSSSPLVTVYPLCRLNIQVHPHALYAILCPWAITLVPITAQNQREMENTHIEKHVPLSPPVAYKVPFCIRIYHCCTDQPIFRCEARRPCNQFKLSSEMTCKSPESLPALPWLYSLTHSLTDPPHYRRQFSAVSCPLSKFFLPSGTCRHPRFFADLETVFLGLVAVADARFSFSFLVPALDSGTVPLAPHLECCSGDGMFPRMVVSPKATRRRFPGGSSCVEPDGTRSFTCRRSVGTAILSCRSELGRCRFSGEGVDDVNGPRLALCDAAHGVWNERSSDGCDSVEAREMWDSDGRPSTWAPRCARSCARNSSEKVGNNLRALTAWSRSDA